MGKKHINKTQKLSHSQMNPMDTSVLVPVFLFLHTLFKPLNHRSIPTLLGETHCLTTTVYFALRSSHKEPTIVKFYSYIQLQLIPHWMLKWSSFSPPKPRSLSHLPGSPAEKHCINTHTHTHTHTHTQQFSACVIRGFSKNYNLLIHIKENKYIFKYNIH